VGKKKATSPAKKMTESLLLCRKQGPHDLPLLGKRKGTLLGPSLKAWEKGGGKKTM